MSPETLHSLLIVALIGINTLLSRALPFMIFRHSTPPYITFLGKFLPSAIIAMLIVYCLRNVDLFNAPFGLNEIIAVSIVSALQIWLKIPVISIIIGTISYMILAQSEILKNLL